MNYKTCGGTEVLEELLGREEGFSGYEWGLTLAIRNCQCQWCKVNLHPLCLIVEVQFPSYHPEPCANLLAPVTFAD